MSAVHLDHVSFRHSSAVGVVHDATAHLGPGWTGVVGANGAGKTTLLRLVSGDLIPSGGSVRTDPADAVIITCPQTVDDVTPHIAQFAASWEGRNAALRGRLALDPLDLDRWTTLSPGQRKRWQIGAALADEPDVLLLDEPTNHLDRGGVDLLVSAVERFRGVGLLVSHDRGVLERATTRTLRIDRGEVTLWNGPYSVAHDAWTAAEDEVLADYATLRTEQRKAERKLADERRRFEEKSARFARNNNTNSFKDIDARSAARGAKHAAGEKAALQSLATAAKARQRAGDRIDAVAVTKRVGGDISVDFEPAPKPLLASFVGDLRVAGSRVLAAGLDVSIERSSRIWLTGDNGVGKSTLVEAILAATWVPSARILALPQEFDDSGRERILDDVRALPSDERGAVLAVAARLGVEPDVLLASDAPSPGEVRKLAMALGLGRRAWLVVLDEPTNHLDLPSIERLEAALAAYPGALVVVSHDANFATAVGLDGWRLSEHGIEKFTPVARP